MNTFYDYEPSGTEILAQMDREDLMRCDRAKNQLCTECGQRGFHLPRCPEDTDEEDES